MNALRSANAVASVLPMVSATASPCCCLFQCCSCVNLTFLKTTEGMLKLAEIIIGLICQNLLINYGFINSLSLGSSYYYFLTTTSAGALTSTVVLVCYLISSHSFQLLRQSLFDVLFNAVIAFLHLTSSLYLLFAVYTYLYPVHKLTSMFQVYPTMSTTYILGFILGVVHGYDAWIAYKKYH